jgi:hypothetical protein
MKRKAKELVEKFGDQASDVVDEIIKALEYNISELRMINIYWIDYYKDIKKEIQSMDNE